MEREFDHKSSSDGYGMRSATMPQVKSEHSFKAPDEDVAVLALKALLKSIGITQFFRSGAGAAQRHLAQQLQIIGKSNTQKVERKHLSLRTRMKRLTRKTRCFAKSVAMHALVIGLFINRYEFGLLI